uniref:Small ribosomal subunit protein uS14c n=1 Tax=Caulerpa lentillifera TaxID=148947 RepID=A0A345HGU1_9CHLO|nr:30S ribosomal protein S14 [Caulerpa lentillifera]AXG75831.1 30S ribosomal protein S14 [Caulerpa lentillifera]QKS32317.1 30S ribosomal protein S14 [Caulerpa lentillifera]QUV75614.1 ribosomal protein S14 [Caulerpa lentillifera]
MSKKALIERQRKRILLVNKYFIKRLDLKRKIKQERSFSKKFQLQQKLSQLPKDSSYIRLNSRCLLSGRPKGVFRDFKISRHFLREMALLGVLPGVKKASW